MQTGRTRYLEINKLAQKKQ